MYKNWKNVLKAPNTSGFSGGKQLPIGRTFVNL